MGHIIGARTLQFVAPGHWKGVIRITYADHMANGAFVFGEFRDDWRRFDFSKTRVTMQQGENYAADQIGGHPLVERG